MSHRRRGKGSKVRYVPAHPLALERIHDYLEWHDVWDITFIVKK